MNVGAKKIAALVYLFGPTAEVVHVAGPMVTSVRVRWRQDSV
jgi:hypothetical protein